MFPEKPRVVIDTGVFVSRLLRPDSIPGQAVALAQRKATLLISQDTMAELLEVLTRPKFAPYIDAGDLEEIIQALARIAEVIRVSVKVSVCRDPDDDKLLALAAAGGANFIVTGDDDLLVLNPFGSVAIIKPRQFVDGYSENSPPAGT